MIKFWKQNKSTFILIFLAIVLWRIVLYVAEIIGYRFIPQHPGYIGPISWANMDGIHYLSIAQNGYHTYEQAFFPVFPLLIKLLSMLLLNNFLVASLVIGHISLFISLFLLYKLVLIDYDKKTAYWVILFSLSFPTSFFLGSVYTENLFLAFTFGCFFAARKKRWVIAGILGALASGTRLVGIFLFLALLFEYFQIYQIALDKISQELRIFIKKAWGILLVPLGLVSYMYYLLLTTKDALAFFHMQSAFGYRSGNHIILLPQVFFRYYKILTTIPLSNHDFWIALLEITTGTIFMGLLMLFWRKIRPSYLLFSVFAIMIPTLTGTFLSMPRFILVVFPVMILFASIASSKVKVILSISFIILLIVLTAFFTQGYFIA